MTSDAIDRTLLPRSARIDPRGRCSVGGVDLVDLAAEFGTPLYVYDEAELRTRCREYRSGFGDGVAYAGKAALFGAMVRLVAEEGLHLDVATGGELHVALAAGFPPARILFHGNNKSDDELARAVVAGVGRIVVDSHDEIARLAALAEGRPAPIAVLVRVTPGVEAHTHAFIETGVDDSKFGFSLATGDAVRAAATVVSAGGLALVGLHCHIGSQVFRMDSYERAAARMAEAVAAVEAETGATVAELNLGGGLGVRYLAEDDAPTIATWTATVRDAAERALAAAGVRSRPALLVEPGRSIAAPAGLTLYRVGTIKRIPGVRTYVAVDGGMSDNPRPITYGARYEAFLPGRARAPRPEVVTVAGKHCEQGDLLVRDAHLPAEVGVGDVLALPVTGAYGWAMASNYNRVPRPPIVFVADGTARLVVRRETEDDLLALEVDPEDAPSAGRPA